MEAVPQTDQTPRFAITIPRPWTWLIANGTRRDWVIATDPSPLLGHQVALHTAATGDASGWRRLDLWIEGRVKRHVVAERCPHRAIIGVARIVGVDALGAAWRVRFGEAVPLAPVGPVASGDLELWGITQTQRVRVRRLILGAQNPAALAARRAP